MASRVQLLTGWLCLIPLVFAVDNTQVDAFQQKLTDFFEDLSCNQLVSGHASCNRNGLQKAYDDYYLNNQVDSDLDLVAHVSQYYATELSEVLRARVDSIKLMKEKMEEPFKLDGNTGISSQPYKGSPGRSFDAKGVCTPEFDHAWRTQVCGLQPSLATSAWRIPKGVIEDEAITNDVLRSAKLDTLFKQNYDADKTIKWQYIGSINGVQRQWPISEGSKTGNTYNNYDPRERPWYVDTASGTKDIILLMDMSSSMQTTGPGGETYWSLAQDAAMAVLQTLSAKDNIALIFFYGEQPVNTEQLGKRAQEVDGTGDSDAHCFESLVPADKTTIDLMKAYVQYQKPNYYTNFAAAFSAAFDVIEKTHTLRAQTAEPDDVPCQTAILFLTDGKSEKYDPMPVIKDRNKPEYNLRVFSYAIGSGAAVDKPSEISCETGGVFHKIAADNENSLVSQMRGYHEFYHDGTAGDISWVGPYVDASGLGFMVTVAAPYYDPDTSNLMGVAGIDVTIADLIDIAQAPDLGINSYMFIMDDNGRTISHPRVADPERLRQVGDIQMFPTGSDPQTEDINPNWKPIALPIDNLEGEEFTAANLKDAILRDAPSIMSTGEKIKLFGPVANTKRALPAGDVTYEGTEEVIVNAHYYCTYLGDAADYASIPYYYCLVVDDPGGRVVNNQIQPKRRGKSKSGTGPPSCANVTDDVFYCQSDVQIPHNLKAIYKGESGVTGATPNQDLRTLFDIREATAPTFLEMSTTDPNYNRLKDIKVYYPFNRSMVKLAPGAWRETSLYRAVGIDLPGMEKYSHFLNQELDFDCLPEFDEQSNRFGPRTTSCSGDLPLGGLVEESTSLVVTNRDASDIMTDILATSTVERFWISGDSRPKIEGTDARITVKYVGTENGVFRKFPSEMRYYEEDSVPAGDYEAGDELRSYDPRKRPWYYRSKVHPGVNVLSTPYLDAGGFGVVLTLSRSVADPENAGARTTAQEQTDRIAAVMGLDFQYTAFQELLFESAEFGADICNQQKNRCYLIDRSGLITAYHTAGANTAYEEWGGTGGSNMDLTSYFIGRIDRDGDVIEPLLAKSLMDEGLLIKNAPKQDYTTFQTDVTYRTCLCDSCSGTAKQDEANLGCANSARKSILSKVEGTTFTKEDSQYWVRYIENTNMFLIVVDAETNPVQEAQVRCKDTSANDYTCPDLDQPGCRLKEPFEAPVVQQIKAVISSYGIATEDNPCLSFLNAELCADANAAATSKHTQCLAFNVDEDHLKSVRSKYASKANDPAAERATNCLPPLDPTDDALTIGLATGGAVVAVAVGLFIIYKCRKRKKMKREAQAANSEKEKIIPNEAPAPTTYKQPAPMPTQPAYGQPGAQPGYGQPHAQPAYGQAPAPAYGQTSAPPAYSSGPVGAAPAYAPNVPDALPAYSDAPPAY